MSCSDGSGAGRQRPVADQGSDPQQQIGIGVVCPFDMALDRELWRWMPGHVSLYFTRTPYADGVVDLEMVSGLGEAGQIGAAVRSLVAVAPAAVGYACASGSFVHGRAGSRRIEEAMLAAGAPKAVTTSEALARALALFNVDRVAVATPYVPRLTGLLGDYLAETGCSVVATAGLGRDRGIWTIPYTHTRDLIRAADHPDAEAILVSCTNLWTYDILAGLEDELGKPIISANQATAWAMLADAGLADDADHGGQLLFRQGRPGSPVDRCPSGDPDTSGDLDASGEQCAEVRTAHDGVGEP